ncbi:MAG: hypothetical protein SGJ18_11780 [Pseudomonadota bacterium]|nr:hypothetical protein [Pseudomonadota bacterium]
MFQVVIFLGILVGLSANAADSSFEVVVANYEPASHSIKYELFAKNCKEAATVGEAVAKCNPNGTLDVTVPATCNAGDGGFRSPGKSFSIANDSLKAAAIECGKGTIFVKADDVEVPRSVGVTLSDIEKAFAARDKEREPKSTLKSRKGENINEGSSH